MKPARSLGSARTLAGQAVEESRARIFLALLQRAGLPLPAREVRFHDTRDWRFDFAWEPQGLALESQGGHWAQGRARKHGPVDHDKLNEAQLQGWIVLQVASAELATPGTVALVRRALGCR